MQKNTSTKTPRFFRIAQIIGIIGVTALVINFFYQVWHIHATDEQKTEVHSCDLQTDICTRNLQGGRSLSLNITPHPIAPDTALSVNVVLEKMRPDHVALFVFPYPATGAAAQPMMLKAGKKNTYTGTVTLKKTANATQKWVAMVVVESGSERISVPFQFNVNN